MRQLSLFVGGMSCRPAPDRIVISCGSRADARTVMRFLACDGSEWINPGKHRIGHFVSIAPRTDVVCPQLDISGDFSISGLDIGSRTQGLCRPVIARAL